MDTTTSTRPDATCWLCRIIGHKWVSHRKHRAGVLMWTESVIWGFCLRCGAPTPQGTAPEEYAADATTRKGALGSTTTV